MSDVPAAAAVATAPTVAVATALSILEAINELRTEEHLIDILVEVCKAVFNR